MLEHDKFDKEWEISRHYNMCYQTHMENCEGREREREIVCCIYASNHIRVGMDRCAYMLVVFPVCLGGANGHLTHQLSGVRLPPLAGCQVVPLGCTCR